MTLRDYQGDDIHTILHAMAEFKTVMYQLPTGGGKTVIFNEIIRRLNKKGYQTLVMAHRRELISQAASKLYKTHGIYPGIIMSGTTPNYSAKIQVASIQTLTRRNKPPGIKVIIIDEAHRSVSDSYVKILEYYPDAYLLGVTATPWRLSGEGFDHIYNKLVLGPTIKTLENQKFLSKAIPRVLPMNSEVLKDLRMSKGDYNENELSKLYQQKQMLMSMVHNWKKFANGLPTVLFCVDIHSAILTEQIYNTAGISARAVVSKKTNMKGVKLKRQRDVDVKDFRAGKYKVFINVGIATEGTDFPFVRCIQLATSTKSLSKYLQMCGRGSRVIPEEGKFHYVLLDHGNNFFEHGPPNADRKWTLKAWKKKGKRKKKLVRQFKLKLKTGEEMLVSADQLTGDIVDIVELVEVTDLYEFIKFQRFASMRNFKRGWAYFKFIEWLWNTHERRPTRDELQFIAKTLNYSDGWVRAKIYEFSRRKLEG